MKLFLAGLMFLLSTNTFASPVTTDQLVGPPDGSLKIQNGLFNMSLPAYQASEQVLTQNNNVSVTRKSFDQTSNVEKEAYAIYDFSVQGGATGANINLGMNLPAKAVITWVKVDVITAPTALSLSPTIALSAASAGDLFTAQGVSFFSGSLLGTPRGTSASLLKVSAATGVTMNIGGTGALNAGRFAVAIDYYISQ